MKVAIVSRTPLAAAPWELFKNLRRYTKLDVRLINGNISYPDGRKFPHDLLMHGSNGEAGAALKGADVWHINNYLMRELPPLRNGQPVLAQFHSLPRLGNWEMLWKYASIRQPLHEKEYKIPGLPNLIDPDEYYPQRRTGKVKIAFAPTTRLPVGQPNSKGYHEVRAVLNQVAGERDVEIVWIEGRPYEENLRMKRTAHILIDDVVTGNWHRTSLEGCCFGCAVMNATTRLPFVYATLATLKDRLLWLIDDPVTMRDFQERARMWVLKNWHPIDLSKEYENAYKAIC